MHWRDLMFWRRPPIADLGALADFVDEQSAYLVQKGIHDYARARSGHYAKVLFADAGFLDALERSRWSSYPMGLAMVGEVVERVLRPQTGHDRTPCFENLCGLVLSVFDRYPVPAALGEQAWRDARAELARRLQLIDLHPPKRVIDIPQPYVRRYWDLMPFHKEVRTPDFATTHSYLKVQLCNVHDQLTKRGDMPALARLLGGADAGNTTGTAVPGMRESNGCA